MTRPQVGKMLASKTGASLYTPPASGCTGSCDSVWPPLLVVKGRVPTGTSGLGTVSITIGGRTRTQVTYHGLRLYTFVGDSGTSVNGNGVGGFSAATVR